MLPPLIGFEIRNISPIFRLLKIGCYVS